MPSYAPRTYQFRRTVIILPYAQSVPKGSTVVAEVCLMPWRRYVSQIAGQCAGKFAAWKRSVDLPRFPELQLLKSAEKLDQRWVIRPMFPS